MIASTALWRHLQCEARSHHDFCDNLPYIYSVSSRQYLFKGRYWSQAVYFCEANERHLTAQCLSSLIAEAEQRQLSQLEADRHGDIRIFSHFQLKTWMQLDAT